MTVPDQTGQVAIVTGANTGIGKVTALELARAGAHVVLACRSEAKAAPVVDEIRREAGHDNVEFLRLDLGSLDSVRQAAAEFLALDLPLHMLINNAGLVAAGGLTEDGFEQTFGVNHIGPFLFTLLLADHVVDSGPARIVNVASRAHYRSDGLDFDVHKATTKRRAFDEYSRSKLANVLFTDELARRLSGTDVSTFSLHPGVVASDIWRVIPFPFNKLVSLFMITVEEGALTTLHCATSNDALQYDGAYFDECKPRRTSKVVTPELAAELWARSLEWTGAPDLQIS